MVAGLEESPVFSIARIVHRSQSPSGHGSILCLLLACTPERVEVDRHHAQRREEKGGIESRQPISAERTKFASATTAGGTEIAEDPLLGHTASRALCRDLGGQAQEHFPAEAVGKLGCVPRKEEAGGLSVAGNEDDVVGAEHLARSVAKRSNRHNLHVTTLVATTLRRRGRRPLQLRGIVIPSNQGATMGRKAMTVRLDAEQARLLETVAEVDGMPVAEAIRVAIDEHIAARRQDEAFRESLSKLMDENRDILERLAR